MNKNTLLYLLVLAMFLWGGGWTALKILTQYEKIEVVTFWRFFLMSIAFFPIIFLLKKKFIFSTQSILYILIGSILNIVFMFFSYLGVKEGFAGAGSVIITTLSPLITFLIIRILFKTKLVFLEIVGLLIGLIGAVILLHVDSIDVFLNSANLYFLLAAFVWALITILAQKSHAFIHPIYYSFGISIVATFISFIYSFETHLESIFSHNSSFWIALLYLSIFGQTIATTIFYVASGKLGSKVTSSFMFLVPVFALLIAHYILGEIIMLPSIIGGILSIVSIFFINFSNNNKEA